MKMLSKYYHLIEDLKKKYKTLDPFLLANALDVEVRYVPFENNPKGMYTKVKGDPIIFLNKSIEDQPERKFVLSHELYHYLSHEENAAYYIQNDKARSKLETEANKFAIALLTNLYVEENKELPNTVDEVSYKYGVSFKENIERLF